ncbi:hypothetical protein PFLUV_G00174620 [Perca fluviatilis]|uniref:Uncharacterized protein n=1 Tax=Perca fluviatilis TaxID=8168 RepID=A0A6A5DW47_PERFL|nr:hypothetical protein PFLUV_G00174620 [Perca fluviatilis]
MNRQLWLMCNSAHFIVSSGRATYPPKSSSVWSQAQREGPGALEGPDQGRQRLGLGTCNVFHRNERNMVLLSHLALMENEEAW